MAMDSWSQLQGNRAFNGIQLQQAVDLELFTAKIAIPQTQDCLKCEEVDVYVNVNPIAGGNNLALKSQVVTSITYYPITGCHFQNNDTSGATACTIEGTETYYNTTGGDGWYIGDVVYVKIGSEYFPLFEETYVNPSISYTRSGVRSWINISMATTEGIVSNTGNCAEKGTITISYISFNNSGIQTMDLTASNVPASTINITYGFSGQISAQYIERVVSYLISSGTNQGDTPVFDRVTEGFLFDETIDTTLIGWTPEEDSENFYMVEGF